MEPWPAVTQQRAIVSASGHGHATHDLNQSMPPTAASTHCLDINENLQKKSLY